MIEFLTISEQYQPIAALLVVFGMFTLFLRETFPTEVVALIGVSILMVFGLLPYGDAVLVLSNPAPWTIAAMFIVMGALVRTGTLEAFTAFANGYARKSPVVAISLLMGFVVIGSAFVSNTPVVVVMIPVFVKLAGTLGVKPSKILIPLSYGAILGGTLTLIGTSTNLLVDGVAQANGMRGFTIFEVTPLGVILVVWGMVYLRFIAPYLLPDRDSLADLLGGQSKKKFFTEAVIPPESNLIGREVLDVQLFKRPGVRLVDLVRGDKSLRHNLKEAVLAVGDRVVLRTEMTELLSLQSTPSLKRVNQVSAVETSTVEVLITPGCKMIGRALGPLRLRRRYGVYPLAVHRRNQNMGQQLNKVVVRVGDTLLLEGAAEDIKRLADDMDLVALNEPAERGYRRTKSPIAILALLGLVGLAAFNVAPILALAVFAVALVFVTRCIDGDEAFEFVDGGLLVLIFSMLGVGAALQHTGAVQLIADSLAPHLGGLPPFLIVWAIYLLTSVLTELVSNNAVAVVVTPVAIGIATSAGIDPRPLVVAVMVAASASFATPIGYQTNTLVYGPGGYQFKDFLKVGVPLNLSIGLLASLVIPFIWPL